MPSRLDEDECLLNTDGCSHGCQNTPYSFYCTCPDGLTLAADKMTCGGVDGVFLLRTAVIETDLLT